MLDSLQYYFQVLCNGMKTRFRMIMIAHPGRGIRFHKRFMQWIIIPPTLLTLCMRMGWGSGVVSSWCFCTKLQFMNIPVAPESRSVDVEMDAREVREVSLTWMLREWGEFFDRT